MTRSTKTLTWLFPLLFGCGGGGHPDENHGLYINASLGLELVDQPITKGPAAEGNVTGLVLVTKGNVQGDLAGATLSVNGVEVPPLTKFGVFFGYDFSKVTIPDVEPGGSLWLHATLADASADLTLHCARDVQLTSPADGSSASVGDTVTVSWNGTIDYLGVLKPDVIVHSYDPATGARSGSDDDHAVSGQSSESVVLPDPRGSPQWLVELHVPGEAVNDAAGAGSCGVLKRAHLVKK